MDTISLGYFVTIALAITFLCYVHKAKFINAFSWLSKELAEAGKNTSYAMRR